MRRVELPGADDGGTKKAVVISYVPLLAGERGRGLSVGDEEFKRLMAEADRCPSGLADACLWMAEGGDVFPVFVLPHAHAIADHLLRQRPPEGGTTRGVPCRYRSSCGLAPPPWGSEG